MRTLPKERPDSPDDKGGDWQSRHDWTLNGQEMAEGSDGSGNELDGMELGGERNESWREVKMGKARQNARKWGRKEGAQCRKK